MPVFYGWWVVAVSLLCMIFVFGVPTVILPVLYPPIIDELGWSRAQVTMLATMKFATGVFMGVLLGFISDRVDIRRVIIGSSVVSGLAMVSFLLIQSLWQFYLIGFLLGLGSISVTISVKILVSRWFTMRQGVAIGIAMLGTSIAGSFAPRLVSELIDIVGWREAVALMSSGIWLLALPFFLLAGRDAPGTSVETPEPRTLDLTGVVRERSFWFLAAAVFLIGFVDQGVTQHTVLYLDRDQGLGRSVAATALGFIFFTSILGKVGFGWVYDRLSLRGISLCYGLMALSVVLAFPASGVVTLVIFGIVRGLAHGGSIVDIPVMAKHCFGPKRLGRAIGFLTAFVTLGFAAGPPVLGYLYDVQGSYRVGFYLLIGMALAAGLAVLGAEANYWKRAHPGSERPTPLLETSPQG